MGANTVSICELLNTFEEKVFGKEDPKSLRDLCAKAVENESNRFHRERFAQLELIIEYINLPKSYQYKAALDIYNALMANHSYAREKDCECPLRKQEQKPNHHHDALFYSAGEVY
jgi:hypothetical protein